MTIVLEIRCQQCGEYPEECKCPVAQVETLEVTPIGVQGDEENEG